MKKSRNILPQHIPDGQRFTERDLEELNAAQRATAGKGTLLVLGAVLAPVALAAVSAFAVGGAVGYGLAAVLMILMPVLMGKAAKHAAKGYAEAAARLGLSREQADQAVRNRNKGTAAWGTLPQPDPEEARADRKKRRKKRLLIAAAVLGAAVIGFVAWDWYRTSRSNFSEIELTSAAGPIGEEAYREIVSVLDRRYETLRSASDSNLKAPVYKLKDGKILCRENTNLLHESNFELFFLQGALSIADHDTGETLFTESDFEEVSLKEAAGETGRFFSLTFTEPAFERLGAVGEKDTTVALRSGSRIVDDRLSSRWIAEHADDRTYRFGNSWIYALIYYAYEMPLPAELEARIIR